MAKKISYSDLLKDQKKRVPSAINYSSLLNPQGAIATPATAIGSNEAYAPTAGNKGVGVYSQRLGANPGITAPSANRAVASGGVNYQKVLGAPTKTATAPVSTGEGRKASVIPKIKSFKAFKEENATESEVQPYDNGYNYAKNVKEDAYTAAEDEYSKALRDADATYKTSHPGYGMLAEELDKSGLARGGYSDYLAGKAMEARTDAVNAARSQLSYAKMLADSDYNTNIDTANREYKTKVESVLNGIMDGLYTGEVAENILRMYAKDGEIDDATRQMIAKTEAEYKRSGKATMIGAYIDSMKADGADPSESSMRLWLKTTYPELDDSEINDLINGYFNNGVFVGGDDNDEDSSSGGTSSDGTENKNFWDKIVDTITGDSGKTDLYGDPTGDDGGNGGKPNIEPDDGGTGGTGTSEYDYKDSLAALQELIPKIKITSDEWKNVVNAMINANGAYDSNAMTQAKYIRDGLVTTAGTVEANKGWRKNYKTGDNFTVKLGNETYRVESEGEADSEIKNAANNAGVQEGALFAYASQLYVKADGNVYKVRARRLFGNADYDKLWRKVFTKAVDDAITHVGANGDIGDYFGHSSVGEVVSKGLIVPENTINDSKIFFGNGGEFYRLQMGETVEIGKASDYKKAKENEIVLINGKPYIYLGGRKLAEILPDESEKYGRWYENLINYLTGN